MTSTKVAPPAGALRTTRYGRGTLENACGRIDGDLGALKAASQVGCYVAGGEINEVDAHAALFAAMVDAGLRHSDAERKIRRGFAKGAQTPKRAPDEPNELLGDRGACRERAVAWLQAALASDETPTVKAILSAIGRECIKHGRVETQLAYRDLAELAGVTISTINANKPRLRRWVSIIIPPKIKGAPLGGRNPKKSTVWRFLPVDHVADALVSTTTADPSENQFHRRKHEWWCFSKLSPHEPISPEDLVLSSGLTKRTIRAYLKRWVEQGVALVVAGGVIAVAGARFAPTSVDHRAERRRRHVCGRIKYARDLGKAIAKRQADRLMTAVERKRERRIKGRTYLLDRAEKHEKRQANKVPAYGNYEPWDAEAHRAKVAAQHAKNEFDFAHPRPIWAGEELPEIWDMSALPEAPPVDDAPLPTEPPPGFGVFGELCEEAA